MVIKGEGIQILLMEIFKEKLLLIKALKTDFWDLNRLAALTLTEA